MMAVVGLALALARSLGASPAVAGALLLTATPLLLGWMSARPQLIDYACTLALALVLRRNLEQEPRRRRDAIGVGLLTAVWMNLHSGAVLGVGVVVLAGTLALLLRRPGSGGLRWSLEAAVFAALGVVLNPYFVAVIPQSLRVQGASRSEGIPEWQPIHITDLAQDVVLLIGFAALVLAFRRRDAAMIAALAVSFGGALDATRLLPILLLVSVPVLAAAASRPALLRYLKTRRIVFAPAASTVVLAVAFVAIHNVGSFGAPSPALYPDSRMVSAIPRGCHVFNSYLYGGLLELQRPDLRVSLDSRNDLFGPRLIAQQEKILDGKTHVAASLDGADCVLIPARSPLVKELQTSPDWREARQSHLAALFIRAKR
ncbi:hypothetical protein [Curtobacterium ammoniigenes]|uniref:hypothetical protein n=1 Tax=Curtobacterium ammoniigenes TaxID=395387 RepID=UPI0012ED643C|nr:hypothetical protein [Curtobacterium ammoniigenes]